MTAIRYETALKDWFLCDPIDYLDKPSAIVVYFFACFYDGKLPKL